MENIYINADGHLVKSLLEKIAKLEDELEWYKKHSKCNRFLINSAPEIVDFTCQQRTLNLISECNLKEEHGRLHVMGRILTDNSIGFNYYISWVPTDVKMIGMMEGVLIGQHKSVINEFLHRKYKELEN